MLTDIMYFKMASAFVVDLKQLASTHTFCMHEKPWWLSSFQRIVSPMSRAARDRHETYIRNYTKCHTTQVPCNKSRPEKE